MLKFYIDLLVFHIILMLFFVIQVLFLNKIKNKKLFYGFFYIID